MKTNKLATEYFVARQISGSAKWKYRKRVLLGAFWFLLRLVEFPVTFHSCSEGVTHVHQDCMTSNLCQRPTISMRDFNSFSHHC